MKNKIWIAQIPFIILFSLAFFTFQKGNQGELDNPFLREKVYPYLRILSSKFTDFKFRVRGKQKVKKKIVVVGIDSDAIEQIGRWPWRRDYIAILVQSIINSGAKVVGLDMVFSEKDERIPGDIKKILKDNGLNDLIKQHETDFALEGVIKANPGKIVLGWTTELNCRPKFDKECAKFVKSEELKKEIPGIMPVFSYTEQNFSKTFDPETTPLLTILKPIANIDLFNNVATNAGVFNVLTDPDGTVRRTNLMFLMNNRAYPTLALEMARAGLKDELKINIKDAGEISNISFKKSKQKFFTNKMGVMEINFRGPGFTYPYVSALDMFQEPDKIKITGGAGGTVSKKEIFKDAYVLIGATAVGIYDMRSYPFDEHVPGVEGHATILDNLLTGDFLRPSNNNTSIIVILLLMTIGAALFSLLYAYLSATKAFFIFGFIMGIIGYLDVWVYFSNNINIDTSFLFCELNAIYLLSALIKYVLEERDKKFLKSAFGNYISPEVIENLQKSGEKPHLGGEEKVLTAYFTDIQAFSTFSEKLSATRLVQLLNEYLTVMTDILLEEDGTLDKYEGDAIISFFGAPVYFKDHAKRAISVSIKMQEGLSSLRKKWAEEGDLWPEVVHDMKMRIGINTGPIVVGNMGSESRMNFTMMGDTVNLAARLEEAAKQYGIYTHVTEDTKNAAGDIFLYREIDTMKVVGKSAPVTTFEVLGRKSNITNELKKLESLFHEGLVFYKNKKWNEAIEKFKLSAVLESKRFTNLKNTNFKNPSDIYIERCEIYSKNPPDKDWDGVFTLTNK